MYRLRRLRLDTVGHADARFGSEILDLTDDTHQAVDSIWWLRNGGGKSSLFALFYSLVLPDKRDFIGSAKKKSLADYVAGNAVAHVVAEWEDDSSLVRMPTLVTGGVYQWRDFHRPHDVENSWDKLQRAWYLFRPVPGVLTLDTLPVTNDEGRLTREGYLKELARLMEADRRIDLAITRQAGDWSRALANVGLDPSIFRVQREMNRDEGAITELFSFATPERFIDFLIDLVVDQTLPTRIRVNLEQQARTIAQRPAREIEQRFLATARTQLAPVRESVSAVATRGHQLWDTVGVVDRVREHLRSIAQQREDEATTADEDAEQAQDQASQAYLVRRRAVRRAAALQHLAAQLAVREAGQAVDVATSQQQSCALRERAWESVTDLLQHEDAVRREQALRALLDAQEEREAPLRQARHHAAAALRHRLTELATAVDLEITHAEQARATHSQLADAQDKRRTEALKAATAAEQRVKNLRATLTQLEQEERSARQSGLLAVGETAAAALTRYESEESTTQHSHAQLSTAADDLRTRSTQITGRRHERAIKRTGLQADHDSVADGFARLTAEREEFSRLPRLHQLAVIEDGGDLDLDVAGQRLIALLDEHVVAAESALVTEEIDAANDRRAQLWLAREHYLPPPPEVEHAISVLGAVGVTAISGVQYLRQTISTDAHDAMLAAAPAVVGGLVVIGDVPGGDLAQLLRRTELATTTVIQVSTEGTVREVFSTSPVAGAGRAVFPLRPGLLDRDAADREEQRLDDRLAGLQQRRRQIEETREADRALAARLRAHLSVFDARRREQLGAQITAAQTELSAMDRADQDDVASLEKTTTRLAEVEAKTESLNRRLLELAGAIPVLRGLAERLSTVSGLRDDIELEDLVRQEQEALAVDAAEQAEAAREQAAEQQATVAVRTGDAQRYRNELLDIDVPDDIEPAVTAAQALDVLRRQFAEAEIAWRTAIGDNALRTKLDAVVSERGKLDENLRRYTDDELATGRDFAATADAAEPQRRAQALRAARSARIRADDELAQAKVELRQAQQEQRHVSELGREAASLGDGDDEDIGTLDFATAAEAKHSYVEEETRANAARSDANTAERLRDGLRAQASRHRQDAAGFSASERVLEAATATVPPLSGARTDPDVLLERDYGLTVSEVAAFDVIAARELESTLGAAVQAQLRGYELANRELGVAARALREFAQQLSYASVDRRLVARLSDEPDVLCGTVDELTQDIQLRESIVSRALAAIEHDQLLLVKECATLVKSVVDDLDQVSRHSVLPAGLHNWSGERFLSLDMARWGPEEELHRRLSAEIDRMVVAIKPQDEQKALGLPEPMAMTKRLVLAAFGGAGNVTAKVLKPKPTLVVERASVTQIQKFSGGELLTVSVLLYCTLAKLRVANRGKHAVGGVGTLLLDNPFGKATYKLFVKLQRQVASAHGVQLVYATAVRDLLAIGQFPLILRMRNQTDERTRRQYVRVVERLGDSISAAIDRAQSDTITGTRLHRREDDEDA